MDCPTCDPVFFGLVGFAPLADPGLGCRWFGSRFGSRSPRRLRKLPSTHEVQFRG